MMIRNAAMSLAVLLGLTGGVAQSMPIGAVKAQGGIERAAVVTRVVRRARVVRRPATIVRRSVVIR